MSNYNRLPKTGHLSRGQRKATKVDLSAWHVLIVDDKADNLAIAEAAMKFNGAEVKTAINGVQALSMMATFTPTVILLDLSMPEMDGWEMIHRLKANPETANIPVIALTAHAMASDRERVMAAGFTGYISKPYTITTLVKNMQTILDNIDVSE
ncbi:MAG: hypothetical protein Phog2KO_47600 [Phototrophicaceae bacterium]